MAEMEHTVEATGADVEAAIAAGLEELQVDRDAVEVQVLDEGSRGVFGLGARAARVLLAVKTQPAQPVLPDVTPPAEPVSTQAAHPETEPPATEPPAAEPEIADSEWEITEKDEAEIAHGALLELLTLMGIRDVTIDVRRAEAAPGESGTPLVFDITGPDVNILIGRHGETLAALQHIARLIVGQETTNRTNLVVDVDGYKAHREQALRQLAERLAEQAVHTDRRVVLEPMPPHERRIIHLTLRDHPKVTTESIGERDRRKVTIIPKHR
ncbi:MAG: protein jag [Anaerolineae bacterium]|nr:protein jag [Anaerolineae bacterium]